MNAIKARQDGVFDDPDLMSIGPLTTSIEQDVCQIKALYLVARGFTVGARDPRFNRNYPGRYMVIEEHEADEGPTDDGSNGPWCIVGDILETLVNTAWDCGAGEFELDPHQPPAPTPTPVQKLTTALLAAINRIDDINDLRDVIRNLCAEALAQ